MATFAHGRADSINKRTGKLAEGSPSDVAKRREMVASLRLRGATYLEIREILAANGIINHTRGKPWSKSAIFDDIQAARTQWLTNAAADVKEHYSRILAELGELKKSAWSTGDLTTVLRAISQECKILGLNSPVKVELSLTETDKKADEVLGQLPIEKLEVLREVFVQLTAAGVDPKVLVGQLVA